MEKATSSNTAQSPHGDEIRLIVCIAIIDVADFGICGNGEFLLL